MVVEASRFRFAVRACGLAGVALLSLASGTARAAELRVSYAELAGVVQTVVGTAKIHLDNKPGGVLSFGTGSTVSVGGKTIAVPIPAKSFQILGSTYAYYVNDINSTTVRASAAPGAVRLSVQFEANGSELVTGCVSGGCGFQDALPNVEWQQPSVSIDVVPIAFSGSVALKVTSVQLGGTLKAVCKDAADFFQSGACEAGLGWANKTIAKLKSEIAAQLKDKMNAPELQQAIASGLKPYLSIGQAGSVSVSKVVASDTGVAISFVLMTNGS